MRPSVIFLALSPLLASCAATSPLYVAAQNSDIPAMQKLLDEGADPNLNVGGGQTPLMVAAQRGTPNAVRLLLAHGANPDARDSVFGANAEGWAEHNPENLNVLREFRAGKLRQPGNLDPDAMKRMLDSSRAQNPKAVVSDVDSPSRRGAERPDDFALVIGIDEYQTVPKADYGVRDAKAVRRNLEALGIPARNIISLEGSAATGNKLKSYLEEWLPLNVKPSSTLWVYYSGHGAPDPKTGEAFLVPWDGDPQFLKSTALPLRQLYADLAKTKAKRVIVALDACFSGAGGRSVLAKGARPLVTKADQGASADARVTILAAASGDQITGTLEEQGHGMFTYFLLKGLADGKSSAKTLFDFLDGKVQDEARRQNREQTPALIGEDTPL
jgi:hypothetical protein